MGNEESTMNILVVGSGGREHELCWKLAQGAHVNHVYAAPGNAGTAGEPGVTNVALDVMDFEELAGFAKSHDIALTVIGPEAPLVTLTYCQETFLVSITVLITVLKLK